MKKFSLLLSFVALLALFVLPVKADDSKIFGDVIMDFYYLGSSHVADPDIEGDYGFWLRRAYFGYETKLTEKVKIRLRFEMASNGDLLDDSKDKIEPYVKDAYLQYSAGKTKLVFGIQSTPAFSNQEKVWGYRPMEKTPLDLHKFAGSRDFGFGAKGKAGDMFHWWVLFANGEGYKAEVYKGKKFCGSLGFGDMKKGFYGEIMGLWVEEGDDKTKDIYQGFLAYQASFGRFGVSASVINKESGDDDYDWTLLSGFFVLNATDKLDFILRYDNLSDPNPKAEDISYLVVSPDAAYSMYLLGASYSFSKKIKFMPSINYITYDDPECSDMEKPDDDMMAKLTLYYKF